MIYVVGAGMAGLSAAFYAVKRGFDVTVLESSARAGGRCHSYFDPLFGAEIDVPTLDGNVKVKVPAGTQPGDINRMQGKGIQRLNSRAKGDQYVHFTVAVPKEITPEQRDLIMQLEQSFGTDVSKFAKKKRGKLF